MMAAGNSVSFDTSVVQANGKSFTVQWTTIDLRDPYLRVMPVSAADGIGHVESFSSIVERTQAVAALNGTFFDAYESDETRRYPNGLMIESGKLLSSPKETLRFQRMGMSSMSSIPKAMIATCFLTCM